MRIFAVAAAVAVLWSLAAPASADMFADCRQNDDPDLKISGCTAAIQSGQFTEVGLAITYAQRGIAYLEIDEYRRAIDDFDQSISFISGDFIPYANRGLAYRKLGEYRRAIDDFDQAIRLQPDWAEAYQERGYSYESLGDYERAAGDWERAIRIGGASAAEWWQNYLIGEDQYAGAIDGTFSLELRRALMACARDPEC